MVYPSDDRALRVRLLIQKGRVLRARLGEQIERARAGRDAAEAVLAEHRSPPVAPTGTPPAPPR